MQTTSKAVDMWYDEIKDYDFGSPGFDMKTGHFTQVVWKGTTKLGCGYTEGYVACRYCDTAGNITNEGMFKANVLPEAGTETGALALIFGAKILGLFSILQMLVGN